MPHEADIEAKSGQQLTIVSNGSSRGMADLVSGAADIGMISAPLESVAEKMNKKEPGSVDVAALQAHQIGEAKVAFTVHPSNSVKELTLAQIKDILNGTTKDWSDLGGAPGPILLVCEDSKGGLRAMVEGDLLDKAPFSANMRELPNGSQIPKVVAQIPQAFGVMSAALVDGSVAEVTTDSVISQPLILVTKGAPTPEMQAVIDAAKSFGG